MSSDYWEWLVRTSINFATMMTIGLWGASSQGGGWTSLESTLAGS